jgi:AcrR family transcriptional regulator
VARSFSNSRQKRSRTAYSTNVPTSPHIQRHSTAGTGERGGRITDASNQQFERIQKVAADLFATRGFRAVGVAEIGDAVGLGRGALYYHISSKEDLLFSIVVHYIEVLVAFGRDLLETEPDPRKRIYSLSRHLIQTIFANLSEMTVCFREADCLTGQRHRIVAELHQAYQDIWMDTMRDGEKKGLFRPLPAVAIKGILGMYFYTFLWLKSSEKKTSGDIADTFADMALSIAEINGRRQEKSASPKAG